MTRLFLPTSGVVSVSVSDLWVGAREHITYHSCEALCDAAAQILYVQGIANMQLLFAAVLGGSYPAFFFLKFILNVPVFGLCGRRFRILPVDLPERCSEPVTALNSKAVAKTGYAELKSKSDCCRSARTPGLNFP